jgi:hypothetical protein
VISDATSPAEESLYYDAAQLFTRANPAESARREYFANASGDVSNADIVSRRRDAVARVTGS